MAVERAREIKQRRVRRAKVKKLRAHYNEAKSAMDKEKVMSKAAKVIPWMSAEQFIASAKI